MQSIGSSDGENADRPLNALVLGGYGKSGARVAALLGRRIRGGITVAGRSGERAERCAVDLQSSAPAGVRFLSRAVDMQDAGSLTAAAQGQDVLIVCAPMDTVAVANVIRAALDARADCVEISPGIDKFRVFAAYRDDVEAGDQRFVLDAGADPGLPGWLARYAASLVDAPDEITLYAKYRDRTIGAAGIRDILEFMSQPPQVFDGAWRKTSRARIAWPRYPGGMGRSPSVPVFLEELASVPGQTGVTRLAFFHGGVNRLTDVLTLAWTFGLDRLLPESAAIRAFQFAIRRFTPEPTGLAMTASVTGRSGSAHVQLWHPDLYHATAQVTVLAVLALRSTVAAGAGVGFPGDWIDAADMAGRLQRLGFRIDVDRRDA